MVDGDMFGFFLLERDVYGIVKGIYLRGLGFRREIWVGGLEMEVLIYRLLL